ncbi:hypothetical protein ACMD2_17806 [Ananas comosus]|uniref:HAT C-terminal dimerisation domain-containing protein n=1 Tax=Ananas comosus TaxID=4615 RepID=A0A199VIY0_ANACO|nr:hypothetical protein ACMD2_17806 [Ananas comosus]
MVKFTGRELVHSGITRFATNFIALNSILQNKNRLKSMFASDEWQTSRYASTVDGKSIEQIILSAKFWDYVKEIVDIVEPLYVVHRLVDQKKIPQMRHTLRRPDEPGSTSSRSAKHLKKIVVRVLSQTTMSSRCERNWSTFALIHNKVCNRLAYARLEKLVYVYYNMRLRLRCMQEEYDKEKELKTYDPLGASFINDESDPILDWLQDRDNQDDPLLDEPEDPP